MARAKRFSMSFSVEEFYALQSRLSSEAVTVRDALLVRRIAKRNRLMLQRHESVQIAAQQREAAE